MPSESESTSSLNPDSLKSKFTIKVLGVGGAGCNAVNHLYSQPLAGVEFILLNTDAAALSQSSVERQLILGAKLFRGLGAGGDPARGRQAAEDDMDQIRALCEGADIVFVVAGLGGGTGTGAAPVVARAAKEAGALVLSVVMLPFDCEGARRQGQAQFGLRVLKDEADGVICLPNQKVFKLIDEKTSLVEAFAITNDLVTQGIHGIWRVLSKPGLINVDFADLCSIAQGRHSESALVAVAAQGEQRIREVTEKLMNHPLMEEGQALDRATGLLVCIAGGPELSMADLEKIMIPINRRSESAHIIMGASVDEAFSGQMHVTLVASCGDAESVEVTEVEENGSDESAASDRVPSMKMDSTANVGRGRAEMEPARPGLRIVATSGATRNEGRPLASMPRKPSDRLRQGQLPLEIISKGRFEKSQPTLHRGEDLDVPTYIRRGVALN